MRIKDRGIVCCCYGEVQTCRTDVILVILGFWSLVIGHSGHSQHEASAAQLIRSIVAPLHMTLTSDLSFISFNGHLDLQHLLFYFPNCLFIPSLIRLVRYSQPDNCEASFQPDRLPLFDR
jgi:hypothetical protein